jgi:hypothetical protein
MNLGKFLLVQPNIGPFLENLILVEVHMELKFCNCRHHGDDIKLDLEVIHDRRLVEFQGMHKTPTMASGTTKNLSLSLSHSESGLPTIGLEYVTNFRDL